MEHIIDATGKRLGRLASEIAVILQGKKSVAYESRLAGTDKVTVKNAGKMTVSGEKMKKKKYYHHTSQIGHLRAERLEEVWEKRGPGEVLRRAVRGMLPKNKLQKIRMKRLTIEK